MYVMLEKDVIRRVIRISERLKTLTEDDILEILQESNALIVDDHFELLGGLHTPTFLQFALVDGEKAAVARLARELSAHFNHRKIDAIIVPTTAALDLGTCVGIELRMPVIQVDPASDGRPAHLGNGFEIEKGSNILVINDLSTTAAGIERLFDIVEEAGANVAGIGLFATRYKATEKIQAWRKKYKNVFVIAQIIAEHYKHEDCPLTKELRYSRDYN